MRPRPKPLQIPEKSERYWCVTIEDHGEHWFRFPSYSRAMIVLDYGVALKSRKGSDPMKNAIELAGLTIGYFWWHRGSDLGIEMPHTGASHETMSAYAEQVLDVLQEAEYSMGDIMRLHAGLMPRLNEFALDALALISPAKRAKIEELAKKIAEVGGEPEPDVEKWTEEDSEDPGFFSEGAAQ